LPPIAERILKENILPALKAFRRLFVVAGLAGALAGVLAGCSRPADPAEDIRPVRTMVLAPAPVDASATFSGEVRPRIESKLGFQVAGKITARKVDVGNTVHRGQVLMQLDPEDLRLSQNQSQANLRAAETNRDLAKAEVRRYQELRVKNFVSQAVIDGKLAAFQAAQATVDAAQAGFRGQTNQAGYATLVADGDGVVTSVDAEVGQVVTPGVPVVRVARAGERDVVINVPEDQVERLRKVEQVTVRLWAMPGVIIPGRLREMAPVADPATRTYQFKIAIPAAAAASAAAGGSDVKLGQTAQVLFSASSAAPRITVPLSALHQERNVTSVWLVGNAAAKGDNAIHTVRLVPVTIGGVAGNDVQLIGGVKPGQTVVTAGANLLKEGQQVKLLAAENAGLPVPAGAAR
jgi:multidrug efflux system membrane fusion protein